MMLAFLAELGQSVVRLFLNPIFYLAIVFAFVLAFRRVRKERLHFHTRVYDVISDLYHTFVPGLLVGVLLYGLFIGLGFTLNEGVLVLLMTIIFLLSLTFLPRLLSPAYLFFITAIIIVFMPDWEMNHARLDGWLSDLEVSILPSLFLLMTILLFVEAVLIFFQAHRQASPRRVVGTRGKPIGGFETRRVWLIPTCVLIPGAGFERIDWWPLLGLGDSFALMLVPFLIGYEQFQTSDLPKRAVKRDGLRVALVSIIALPIAILSIYYEWIALAFVGMAFLSLSRLLLFVFVRKENDEKRAWFTLRNEGLQVLAVVPKSPAAEMNIHVGEVINRVNGMKVNSARQYYDALQINPTFVKLEVIDADGELRFEQRPLYENEHHSLGILFVDEPRVHYRKVEEA